MELVKEQFNPNKKYKWQPTDVFEISGSDFGLLLNALRATLMTEESQRILLIQEASNALENVLAKGVESGIAVEHEDSSNSL